MGFFFSVTAGKAYSPQFCVVPRPLDEGQLQSCDFPRLWLSSGLPVSPPDYLNMLTSFWKSSINTSVDRSYLRPSKSKWVQGRLEYEDGNRYQPTSRPCCISTVVRVEELAQVVIRLTLDSGVAYLPQSKANHFRHCKKKERSALAHWACVVGGRLSFVMAYYPPVKGYSRPSGGVVIVLPATIKLTQSWRM